MAAKLRGENVLVKKGVFEGVQSEGKKKDIDPVERRGRVRKRKQTCVVYDYYSTITAWAGKAMTDSIGILGGR